MKTLALQGGGVLGYGQAIILAELEKRAGRPCCELFGFMAGTSVGSINAAPLSIGISAKTILDFYTKEAPAIFDGSFIDKIDPPMYDAHKLEQALFTMLGSATLADCKCRLVIPAFDCVNGYPVYFDSDRKSGWKADRIIIGNDSPIELWKMCRASAAAQGYFSGYELGKFILIDGGNTSDNAPDMAILEQIIAAGQDVSQVEMLSLGNGAGKWDIDGREMISPGWLTIAKNTIKTTFAAGEDVQVGRAAEILGSRHSRIFNWGLEQGIDDASPEALQRIFQTAKSEIFQNDKILNHFASCQ